MNDTEARLVHKKCIPCEAGGPALTRIEAMVLLKQIPGWHLNEGARKLGRTFRFKDFKEAMAFADTVGEIAEEEGHHPDLHVAWGKVRIELSTHAVRGLSENDFIMAAKIDQIG
jgi:4a-hydroxytetrahydrobiopterin dehydratase